MNWRMHCWTNEHLARDEFKIITKADQGVKKDAVAPTKQKGKQPSNATRVIHEVSNIPWPLTRFDDTNAGLRHSSSLIQWSALQCWHARPPFVQLCHSGIHWNEPFANSKVIETNQNGISLDVTKSN